MERDNVSNKSQLITLGGRLCYSFIVHGKNFADRK